MPTGSSVVMAKAEFQFILATSALSVKRSQRKGKFVFSDAVLVRLE